MTGTMNGGSRIVMNALMSLPSGRHPSSAPTASWAIRALRRKWKHVANNRSKRPRDTNQLAKFMVDILTGEVEDRERTPEERGVDPAASAMGKKGGRARAANMTTERGAEIAKKAAEARWRKTAK
jgi:hypothetical protein